ncbi:MAG: hypothetical protein R3E83_18585 [Burkholderiaceae bacterium]
MSVEAPPGTALRQRALAITMLVLALALIAGAHRVGYPPPAVAAPFETAQVITELTPDWTPIALPDDWRGDRPGLREAFYRFTVELEAEPLRLAALYLPTVSQNAALFVNGVEVGNGGPFVPVTVRHFPRPLLLPIPPDVLRSGFNELVLRVVSDPVGRGFLPVVYFGERDALLPPYRARHALKVAAVFAFGIGQVLLALLLIPISIGLRGESSYGWAGLSIIALTGHMLPMMLERPPMPALAWELWQHVCIGLFVVAISFFARCFLRLPVGTANRLLPASLGLMCAASILLIWSAGEAVYYRVGGALWGVYALCVGFPPMVRMILAVDAIRWRRMALMSAAGALIFVLGAHDVLFVAGMISRQNGYLIHFAAPLATLTFTGVLFAQFVETRQDLLILNRDLERRIDEKSAALEATYQHVARLERERALDAERERLRRDMHDGLGGYLTGALALAERESGADSPLTALLRDAHDEMRLVVEAAGIDAAEPAYLMGAMRERFERQAKAAGMALQWRIEPVSSWSSLGSQAGLELLRIVQEAVNNAVRHSGGSHLLIEMSERDDALVMRIADDGRFEQSSGAGHGLANMHRRAEMLGGQLSVRALAPGTEVMFRVARRALP